MSGSWPKNTTRGRSGWSVISPRHSRTSRSSTRLTTSRVPKSQYGRDPGIESRAIDPDDDEQIDRPELPSLPRVGLKGASAGMGCIVHTSARKLIHVHDRTPGP